MSEEDAPEDPPDVAPGVTEAYRGPADELTGKP